MFVSHLSFQREVVDLLKNEKMRELILQFTGEKGVFFFF